MSHNQAKLPPATAVMRAAVRCEINFPQWPAISTEERQQLQFSHPLAIHQAFSLGEVRTVLDAVDAAASHGHWCVGFVCHEAANSFDAALVTKESAPATPLAWFAEFATPTRTQVAESAADYAVSPWQSETTSAQFAAAVESIRADIREGRFYQVNYTLRLDADFAGSALAFYRALQAAQPNGYHLFIDAGSFQLLSVSPELFFSVRDGVITAQPMKGTAPRGDTSAADAAQAEYLTHSPKERAENLMIVDLLRNDLSRLAKPNSVEVPHLFSLHPLPSVWQMTSTVRATLRDDLTLTDIFASLFPCGSVTGAPKVEAMKAIRDLEAEPRGAYCGALGYVAPHGALGHQACFNVGIRSVWISDGRATFGVGSGITFDSTVAGEAAELAYKARFVQRAAKSFALFETIRLEDGEFVLLEHHLARMENSARHFRFADSNNKSVHSTVLSSLNVLKRQYHQGVWRVKLIRDHVGEIHTECVSLDAPPEKPAVQLATNAVSRYDEFLQHKTTRRETYDRHAPAIGVWDTLLFNEEGELTEFTRANVVLDIDGVRLTPAISCGLLNGTLRTELLARGEIHEATLTRDDLARATKIWWVNGLRGELEVTLQH